MTNPYEIRCIHHYLFNAFFMGKCSKFEIGSARQWGDLVRRRYFPSAYSWCADGTHLSFRECKNKLKHFIQIGTTLLAWLLFSTAAIGQQSEISFHLGGGLWQGYQYASGASGSYVVNTFIDSVGYVTTGNYSDQFNRIRNVGVIGPELNVGYDFDLPHEKQLGLRASVFNSPIPAFMPNFDTPLNPRVFRFNLELAYRFQIPKAQ